MKIGAVCEFTKLSDRTVRYYIEEGLLQPHYTKNYIGRKNFDFSDGDVALLQDIAVLRKYGFSIIDIKTMLDDPTQSAAITRQLTEKKQQTIQSEQAMLDALLRLEAGKNYTVHELANTLNAPALSEISLQEDNMSIDIGIFWVLCGLDILFTLIGIVGSIIQWCQAFLYVKYYPFSLDFLFAFLINLVPFIFAGVMLLLTSRKKRKHPVLNTILKGTIAILFLLIFIPCFLLAAFSTRPPIYSETQEVVNYMQIGSIERNDENVVLLFPESIPESALSVHGDFLPDTTRYYNITEWPWDERFELFAQWVLTPAELESEKNRIINAFADKPMHIVENSEWTCWVFSNYPEYSADLLHSTIIGHASSELYYYNCICFAYRQRDGLVRYIASYSNDNLRTPIFMQLDWS